MAESDDSVSMGAISSGGGLIGGIIDSIVGPIMGVVNAKKAWKRQKKIMKRRIQWMVKDMQKAGINPMILAGGGISAPQGSAPQAMGGETDIGGSFERFSASSLARARNKGEVEQLDAGARLLRQQGTNAAVDRHRIEMEVASARYEAERKRRFNEAGGPEAEAAAQAGAAAASSSGAALNQANKEATDLDNVTRRNQAEAQKTLGPKWRTFKEVVTPFTPFTK